MTRSSFSFTGAVVISAIVVLLTAGAMVSPAQGKHAGDRGQALFIGKVPLNGRIREHPSWLPPEVVKCDNCHGATVRGDGKAKSLAPQLNRSLLMEPRVRRGGPPSAYDPAGFCRLLRTGIDPASILVAREMPTYDIDDRQCAALWRFLTKVVEEPKE